VLGQLHMLTYVLCVRAITHTDLRIVC